MLVPSESAQPSVVGMLALGASIVSRGGLLVLEASTATGTQPEHNGAVGVELLLTWPVASESAQPSVVGVLAWGAFIATTSAGPVLAASTATGTQAEVACSEQGEWALARSLLRTDRAGGIGWRVAECEYR